MYKASDPAATKMNCCLCTCRAPSCAPLFACFICRKNNVRHVLNCQWRRYRSITAAALPRLPLFSWYKVWNMTPAKKHSLNRHMMWTLKSNLILSQPALATKWVLVIVLLVLIQTLSTVAMGTFTKSLAAWAATDVYLLYQLNFWLHSRSTDSFLLTMKNVLRLFHTNKRLMVFLSNLLPPLCSGFCRWWWTVRRKECRCCSWRLWSARGVWTPCPSRWPLTLSTWRASCAHSTTSCTWMAPCRCHTAITSPSWSVNGLLMQWSHQLSSYCTCS